MTEVNRRDFLKAAGVGAAGLGVAAAGSYWNSYHEGQSAFSMQGQEHRQGHEYFNREPFRVDKVTPFSWEVIGPDLPNNHSVGGIHRIDMRWYYGERFKSAGHAVSGSSPALGYDLTKGDLDAMPNTWPSNGLAGLSTFYQEYYDLYPMMVDIDKEYKYDWLPQLVERFQASIESRANFNANEGLIAMARSEAQRAVPVSSITAPPEENDWSGVSARRAVFDSPELASQLVKRMAADLGATFVGVTPLNKGWVAYSHAPLGGLGGGTGGRGFGINTPIKIPDWWDNAILVTGTMSWDVNAGDPNYGDSWTGYNISSQIAQQMVKFLKYLGYPARWHSPFGGYDFPVPGIAAECGMGEIGRTSNCLAPDFGGNVRPAVITTSLPLAADKPVDFNLAEFCSRCKLCAQVCPTQAISYDDKPKFEIYGQRRFNTNLAKCRDGWNLGAGPMGCRACISVCPWTKKNTWVHRFVREVLSHDATGTSQNIAIWAERTLYPKHYQEELNPPNYQGVYEPPKWIQTNEYVSSFVNTPMGVK
ncbi:MAG: 4Fe-4S double cluster binding domain-containing protein [Dehalococcoides mccartyi]|uniref:Reductive dehalogenase, putative n=1 Tax=Dehalococcoides mccartyi (strain ATCC BAA-2266 / KCTC 15142 / 195) TaxID=243164 RepID=Q3Z7B4_DEHM1|nr:4Fe-4S double cluster binding domain-containing protein [Dehalococcoides mccartyi]AAW39605.1 reductive dehalogenase, putative [Dehalococcoides mccartyi 195]AII59730.1 (4Fe-4S)-binding protein [Dehalococcoides mccartyi CG4]MBF4482215.1 4Fe-4S dicluster domain-containing protein [Dehalococcoides mccartyi]MBJ7531793.1 4Fe-4S dicluster domain-containing protein [Dehalococcoides mccartyi]MDN4186705.1 4Fe-4S double cluster binding domain-containing protein [Dehalococcoides mccartyi]